MRYSVLRACTLPDADGTLHPGEQVDDISAADAAVLIEEGYLCALLEDGTASVPSPSVETMTLDRLFMQTDIMLLRQLRNEPIDRARLQEAAEAAESNGRALVAQALNLAVAYSPPPPVAIPSRSRR